MTEDCRGQNNIENLAFRIYIKPGLKKKVFGKLNLGFCFIGFNVFVTNQIS